MAQKKVYEINSTGLKRFGIIMIECEGEVLCRLYKMDYDLDEDLIKAANETCTALNNHDELIEAVKNSNDALLVARTRLKSTGSSLHADEIIEKNKSLLKKLQPF